MRIVSDWWYYGNFLFSKYLTVTKDCFCNEKETKFRCKLFGADGWRVFTMVGLSLCIVVCHFWHFGCLQGDLTNLVHGSHCSKYRLARIPGTNAFVGIVNETCDSLAFCACSMVDRLCLNCHRWKREGSCSPFTTLLNVLTDASHFEAASAK